MRSATVRIFALRILYDSVI